MGGVLAIGYQDTLFKLSHIKLILKCLDNNNYPIAMNRPPITIKTISNTGNVTKNNIMYQGCTGLSITLMILFCIRDSLRESKANYVIISNMQLVLMYCFIISESVIFCILFSMSYVYLLSPICLICKVSLVYVLMNVYELSLKSTNLLSISAIILTCNSLNNNENLICYI